jgi:hypothetical protein
MMDDPKIPDPTPPRKAAALLLPTFGRGWRWLVYLDLVLPAVLWLLAFLLHSVFLARLFHTYGLYVMSPAPIGSDGTLYFLSLSGVPGLLLHLYAVVRALLRRDRLDAVLCLGIAVLVFLFFFFGLNYEIVRSLDFNLTPTL